MRSRGFAVNIFRGIIRIVQQHKASHLKFCAPTFDLEAIEGIQKPCTLPGWRFYSYIKYVRGVVSWSLILRAFLYCIIQMLLTCVKYKLVPGTRGRSCALCFPPLIWLREVALCL